MVSVINGTKQRLPLRDRSQVGEINVPPGHKARFVIDLTTSKVAPEAAFGRQ